MKKRFAMMAAIALAAMAGSAAMASPAPPVTITVFPSLAPNAYGSPSWAGYMANAQTGLQNGLSTVGDRNTDPTGYQVVSSIAANQPLVTSYPSWDGVANPTGAFSSEEGNRLHFGVVIESSTAFSLNEITFSLNSNDSGNTFNYDDNLAGTDFSNGKRVGIYYGADGAKGGVGVNADVTYNASNPGSDATPINELYYVGAGNAWWPGGGDPDPSNPLLGRQGAIDASAAWVSAHVTDISATYTLTTQAGAFSGFADVAVTPVPLPSAAWSGLALLAGLGLASGIKRVRYQKA